MDAFIILLLVSSKANQAIHYTLSDKDFSSFFSAKSFKIFSKSKSLAMANGSSLLGTSKNHAYAIIEVTFCYKTLEFLPEKIAISKINRLSD